MGQTSEHLESVGCGRLSGEDELESEISPYLLLHHDYFAKRDPKASTKTNNKRRTTTTTTTRPRLTPKSSKTKFKEILPKTQKPLVLNVKPEIFIDNGDSSDLVYGTYDQTNCIVILNQDNLQLDEAVTEVVTSPESAPPSPNYLQVPVSSDSSRDSLSSPAPSSGYESLGSPGSEMDIWDECVSELFPSLI